MKSLWLFLILVAIVVVYAPSHHGRPFDDDYSMIRDGDMVRRHGVVYAFMNPQTWGWYRPVRAVMSGITTAPGRLPWGPHVANIIGHCMAVVLVFSLGRRICRDRAVPLLAAGFVAFSQANAMAVLSVDGFNELCVSLAWYGGILLLLGAIGASWRCFASTGLVFSAGLFTKESMAAFPLVAVVAALVFEDGRRKWLLAGFCFLILLCFIVFRQGVVGAVLFGSADGRGTYSFGVGMRMLRNFALLLFSLGTPISSLRLATAGGLSQEIFAVAAAGAFTAAVFYGLYLAVKEKRIALRTCLFLVLALVVSSMPNVFLGHVSELYSYRMSGLYFLLAAIGLTSLARERYRLVSVAFSAVWLAFNLYAVREKAAGIYEAGERAAVILRAIEEALPDPGPDAQIHVYDEWGDFRGRNYSVFSVHGVRVFRTMLDYALNRSYGRSDLVASVDEGPSAKPAGSRPPELYVFRYLVEEDRVEWVPSGDAPSTRAQD